MKRTKTIVLAISAIAIGLAIYLATSSLKPSAVEQSEEARAVAAPEKTEHETGELPAGALSANESVYAGLSFADAKAGADRGEPVAQRILAQMYDECFMYNLDSKKFVAAQMEFVRKQKPQAAKKFDRIQRRYETFCPTVDSGQPIPPEAVTLWLEQSAKSGDVIAKVIVASRKDEKIQEKEAIDLVQEVKEANDPAAVFNTGTLVKTLQPMMSETKLAPAFEGKYAAYAWQIAACRTGYDCSEHATFMNSLCVYGGDCEYVNYEALVFSRNIPPGIRSDFEKQVRFIQENFLDNSKNQGD